MKPTLALLSGAIALVALTSAHADRKYEGILEDNGRNVPILLSISQTLKLGENAGTIRFNGDWKCGFALEFAGTVGKVNSYSLQGPGPGRCTTLVSGYLRKRSGTDGLQIEVLNKANDTVYDFTLRRAGLRDG
ncbi:hypothetical protein [Pseudomonas sp. NPDC089406]|uniref:hypothetical protein n=1 Tax=Pseudomonas sp. NPDC089406 TaxID=3364463 RepID=UPI00384E0D36